MALVEGPPELSSVTPTQLWDSSMPVTQIPRPPQEGLFLVEPPSDKPELYQPMAGTLTPEKIKLLPGGTVSIGTYESVRASRRVGVYKPDNYDPEARLPKVLLTGALITGSRGRNQSLAGEMMRAGYVVIYSGVPRYHGPTLRALSLTEDVNEMFGVLNAVEMTGVVGSTDEVIAYGESQGGMKGLGALAIGKDYGRDMVNGMIAAACYTRKANLWRPDKLLWRTGATIRNSLEYIAHTSSEERDELRGTLSLKDAHHHLAVIPVLLRGEPGSFLDQMDPGQGFTKELYANDDHSHPFQVHEDLKRRFPNIASRVLPDYGHVDGIMSSRTSALRSALLYEIAVRYDARAVGSQN